MIKKRLFSIKMYQENRNGHIYEPDYVVKFTGFNYISVFPDIYVLQLVIKQKKFCKKRIMVVLRFNRFMVSSSKNQFLQRQPRKQLLWKIFINLTGQINSTKKKGLHSSWFPANFTKILKRAFIKNTYGWLPLFYMKFTHSGWIRRFTLCTFYEMLHRMTWS